ncbi:hypothetical protein LTR28_013246 [Elasticomyces elasticus]|nr:hypothetical protein LTR28_013246 [Elasticomyces elasticus]
MARYTFSASSSIVISEFLKFLLSTTLFYREVGKRHVAFWQSYHAVRPLSEARESPERESARLDDDFSGYNVGSTVEAGHKDCSADLPQHSQLNFTSFVCSCLGEVPLETKFGFAQLALLYALINNIVCGLIVTQYHPEAGSTYSLGTYAVLVFQTFLNAVSGVYNQALLKSTESSLHASNMVLYAAGVCINLLIYVVVSVIKTDEPGFFVGYGHAGAITVVVSNVFIGLVITAVYKYADAVVKCFATAVSTAILLYIAPILFDIDFSALVIPGTCAVFLATWLYMEASTQNRKPASTPAAPMAPTLCGGTASKWRRVLSAYSPQGRFRTVGMASTTVATISIIAGLTVWDSKLLRQDSPPGGTASAADKTHESPFKNTLAYVRWTGDTHPERMATIDAYTPFFHTMHYSMPNYTPDEGKDYVNLTHDSWEVSDLAYQGVATTMQRILNGTNNIEGILFFHFDAWIDPMGFQDMDRKKIWFPDSPDPRFMCMSDTARHGDWHGWDRGSHESAMKAARAVHRLDMDYVVDTNQWCVDWSEIYFTPRTHFSGFITLSRVFFINEVFHEVAIPTMLRIIDQTSRTRPRESSLNPSLISHLGDCWGHCCASDPTAEDILWKRCGHRLDFAADDVWLVHFVRLDKEARALGLAPVEIELP